LHTLSTAFVLAYHGCDRSVANRLVDGEPFRFSDNDYDWLGSGVYFGESNPRRALRWAEEMKSRGLPVSAPVGDPSVVGAVVDMGFCLDLLTESGIAAAKDAYYALQWAADKGGITLPENEGGEDLLLRRLDCAVINTLHEIRKDQGKPAFDSVRGVFLEGKPIYRASGFREKTHIQICVRNLSMIKAAFRVTQEQMSEG
jgi:hypothetical protein